ncbi:MAG: PASTA domain-containing protein, partial [Betaproteobacteria bacterium]
KKIDVPDVVGKPYDEASALLGKLELKVTRKDQESDKPAGQVLDSDPKPATPVDKSATVALTVAKTKPAPPPPPPPPPVVARTDISGNWDSSINFKYRVVQNATVFRWVVTQWSRPTPPNEIGSGVFTDNDHISIQWQGGNGNGTTKGRVAFRDANGNIQVVKWDNGVIWVRPEPRIIIGAQILNDRAMVFKHFAVPVK